MQAGISYGVDIRRRQTRGTGSSDIEAAYLRKWGVTAKEARPGASATTIRVTSTANHSATGTSSGAGLGEGLHVVKARDAEKIALVVGRLLNRTPIQIHGAGFTLL